ncbi:hypothetical protein H9Y04_21115 [Streptomyces sp. TRM66268-LWL]|uniref:Lipoprotein n=1 Tax=Streptomyces polyasparticus TaxID=2767826 RepID=A0ABR7SHS6_9ACTN|nr:hypothetical protein [Streptomyces polyasparticus]MBC9715055.1 hypothetical protein [Streptomyces polyasparticus]
MRVRQLTGLLVLLLAGMLSLAGCGDESSAGGGPAVDGEGKGRARQVSDAWRGSDAAQQWREGFFPLEELVWLPADAWHSSEDKIAYGEGRFTVAGELSDKATQGKIRWEDSGESLGVQVLSAEATLELFRTQEPSGEGQGLTITQAKLDLHRVATSRGPASVPVWYFTVQGYDQPLIRAAVAADAITRSPIGPVEEQTDDLMPLDGLGSVSGDGRSLVVLAGHGACDDGPVVQVLETDENVVLTASVRGRNDGPCTDQLLIEKVTVKLKQPLGKRVLLDAFTGVPVELKGRQSSP